MEMLFHCIVRFLMIKIRNNNHIKMMKTIRMILIIKHHKEMFTYYKG